MRGSNSLYVLYTHIALNEQWNFLFKKNDNVVSHLEFHLKIKTLEKHFYYFFFHVIIGKSTGCTDF